MIYRASVSRKTGRSCMRFYPKSHRIPTRAFCFTRQSVSCPGSRRADISPLTSWTGECQRTCRHSPPTFHKVPFLHTKYIHCTQNPQISHIYSIRLRPKCSTLSKSDLGRYEALCMLLFQYCLSQSEDLWTEETTYLPTTQPSYTTGSAVGWLLYTLIQNIVLTIKFIQVFHNTEEPKQAFWPTNKSNGSQSHWFIAFLKSSWVPVASLLIMA